ncbi:ester cyclase [Maribacter sp. CXY002]|uniref:ester cyclase n=1 Tax=Maribacter luteocoastalis TaxID=3407671 RepID=UPI003B670843
MGIMKSTTLVPLLLLFLTVYCGTDTKQVARNSDDTKLSLVTSFESYVQSVWNEKNMDSLKIITTENFVRKLNGVQIAKGQHEVAAHMNIYFKGFPNTKIIVEDLIFKDNQLFVNWTYTGTHTGTFKDVTATGKKVNVSGHSTFKFNKEGKIMQEDVYFNELELLQQLGYTLNEPNMK